MIQRPLKSKFVIADKYSDLLDEHLTAVYDLVMEYLDSEEEISKEEFENALFDEFDNIRYYRNRIIELI